MTKCVCPANACPLSPSCPCSLHLQSTFTYMNSLIFPEILLSSTDLTISIHECETERDHRMCSHSHQAGIRTPDITLHSTRKPPTARPRATPTREVTANPEVFCGRKTQGYTSARPKSKLTSSGENGVRRLWTPLPSFPRCSLWLQQVGTAPTVLQPVPIDHFHSSVHLQKSISATSP